MFKYFGNTRFYKVTETDATNIVILKQMTYMYSKTRGSMIYIAVDVPGFTAPTISIYMVTQCVVTDSDSLQASKF